MTARRSPAIPTPKQIKDAHDAVASLHPGARIVRVGPEGVTFDYPESVTPAKTASWAGRAFSDKA